MAWGLGTDYAVDDKIGDVRTNSGCTSAPFRELVELASEQARETDREALDEVRMIDPTTAYVWSAYADCDGGWIGRSYYWTAPSVDGPAVEDQLFRRTPTDVDPDDWDRLFYEAVDRSQTTYEADRAEEHDHVHDPHDPITRIS